MVINNRPFSAPVLIYKGVTSGICHGFPIADVGERIVSRIHSDITVHTNMLFV